jgi:septum formation protein
MLLDLLAAGGGLAGVRLILASASPRRLDILEKAGGVPRSRIEVLPSSFPEDLDARALGSPAAYAAATARGKAFAAAAAAAGGAPAPAPLLLIAADSVVVACGALLEKPADAAACAAMLRALCAARTHAVVTAVALLCTAPRALAAAAAASAGAAPAPPLPAGASLQLLTGAAAPAGCERAALLTFCTATEVDFVDDIPDAALAAYLESGDGMDKAGGYGVQSLGASFVRGIRGCYHNAAGLPFHDLAVAIRALVAPPALEALAAALAAAKADAAP